MNGQGGKILGEYPSDFTENGAFNIDPRGRLIPTTSWDAIMNAVAEWVGVTDSDDLTRVLPNRNKFSNLLSRDDVFKPDDS